MAGLTLWQKKGGYYNWYLQRATTVFTVIFIGMVLWQMVVEGRQSIIDWHAFMQQPLPFIISEFAMISMVIHAYIGLWTVLTDYVKGPKLQKTLHLLLKFSVIVLLILILHVIKGVHLL